MIDERFMINCDEQPQMSEAFLIFHCRDKAHEICTDFQHSPHWVTGYFDVFSQIAQKHGMKDLTTIEDETA